jgi:hypothetical protein
MTGEDAEDRRVARSSARWRSCELTGCERPERFTVADVLPVGVASHRLPHLSLYP